MQLHITLKYRGRERFEHTERRYEGRAQKDLKKLALKIEMM